MSKQDLLKTKHFCLVPWTHLHIWPNSSVHLCCTSDSLRPLTYITEKNTLEKAWNNKRLKEVRLDMLQDKAISECTRCYEIEASGLRSMRVDHNLAFEKHMQIVEETRADGTVEKMNMPYMDIRFSNICNLRCRTCGPELSSNWFKDAVALQIPMQHKNPILQAANDPQLLFSQIEKFLPSVEQIYFAGGEPLIMEEHYKILHWLIQNSRTDVELRYNTNFTITSFQGKSVFELWNKFKKVEVGASLDTFGTRAEYMRKESDWAKIEASRMKMKEICPKVGFYVSVTLSILSFSLMPEFHRDWVARGLVNINDWNINPLTFPLHYRVQVAPEFYRNEISKKYADHIEWIKSQPSHNDMTLDRWNSALRFIQGEQSKSELENFKAMTNKLDSLRGERFQETFPELSFLMNE